VTQTRVASVLLIALLLPRGGSAQAEGQGVASSKRLLTLERALAMARKANRTLIADRARVAQARANIEQAWAALFPTVSAQGKYTRNNVEASIPLSTFAPTAQPPPSGVLTLQARNQLDGAISFTAPLLAPAAYPALEAVKTSMRSAEADYETSEATVLYGVAQAFYAAAISDEVMLARLSNVEVAMATLQDAQIRFVSGTVTKVDVDRAELALVRANQAVRDASLGQEQTYRALATLIRADTDFKVETSAAVLAAEPEQDLGLALQLRPELRALSLSAKSLQAQERANAWRWLPSLSGFGNAHIFNYDNFARQHHAWAIGAQLDWMIYDGGTRDADRHLAAARALEAEARADVLRDGIRDDLANNRGLLATKRRAKEAAERSVTLATETLALVRAQYEAGKSAQLDLLEAQDGLVSAKVALAQARFEVGLADLGLRRAAGTFPGK